MKKRIAVVLLLGSFLVVKSVFARSFDEIHDYDQSFVINIPSRNIKITKSFVKVTDENDTPYYDVNPTQTIFTNWDFYEEVDADFTLEYLQAFSKITYFGYGYQGKRTNAYYYATQYLMYQVFKDMPPTYELKEGSDDYLAPLIREIENNMESVTFSLKDFTTKDTTYEITNSYIVDNFTVQGEHINVTNEDKKIKIEFLDNQKEYVLDFEPKNMCNNNKVWKAGGVRLFKRSEVCEQDYQVKVTYQIDEKEETSTSTSKDIPKKEILNETKKEKKKESVEVKVPSTGKNEFPYSIFICLIGAIWCVLKK